MIPDEVKFWLFCNKEMIMKFTIAVIALALTCLSCSAINQYLHMKDDNMAEEFIEDVIESQTGLDIDLTPGSKE